MPRPFREIFVPRLAEAPPLYRWGNEVDDDITVSAMDDDEDIVRDTDCMDDDDDDCMVADERPTESCKPDKDLAPRKPQRRGRETGHHRQDGPNHDNNNSKKQALPPRRPRRSASPPRYLTALEINAVSLQPCQGMTDQEGRRVMVQVKHTEPVSLAHILQQQEHEQALLQAATRTALSPSLDTSQASTDPATSTTAATTTATSPPGTGGVTIVFCIRNSSCGAVRNHGLQLTELSQRARGKPLHIMGVIKKNAQREQEFYKDYFSFPLYTDNSNRLFTALGERKVSVLKMIQKAPKLLRTCHKKKIKSIFDLREDFWLQGGLLIFDAQQRLRFVYYEKFADDLDLQALEWAIEQAQTPLSVAPEQVPTAEVETPTAPASNDASNNNDHRTNTNKRPRSPIQSTSRSAALTTSPRRDFSLHSPWYDPASQAHLTSPKKPTRSFDAASVTAADISSSRRCDSSRTATALTPPRQPMRSTD